jgi:hypothetical protein
MKLKVDDQGHVVLQDGKPVYIGDDSKEYAFDGPHLYGRVQELTRENAKHRTDKEAAEGKLKAFEGIEDPGAALKALETVKNLEDGQLVTAGKVEEIKQAAKQVAEAQVEAATKQLKDQLKTLSGERDKVTTDYFNEKIGTAFANSPFIKDKTIVPPDMLKAMFGTRFKVENGKLIPLDAAGQPLYSRTKGGEIAEFDEAVEAMIDAYPNRDAILRGTGSGSGARGGNGGGGGGKTLTRQEFSNLSPADQSARMKDGYAVVD